MGNLLDNKGKIGVYSARESCWEVELDTVEKCSKAPSEIEVLIEPLVKVKIERLMEKFKSTEWLAYLLGEGINVTDIYIPKQKVSAGSVTDIETSACNRLPVIGVIHSHHSMGHSFSGTDNEWINQNNDISLCISHDGISGHVRWETPCGSMKTVDAKVKLNMKVDYDENLFDKDVNDKIEKEVFINTFGQFNNKNEIVTKFGNINGNYYGYEMGEDEDDDGIDDFLESIDDDERTLEEELSYIENSGMYDKENE